MTAYVTPRKPNMNRELEAISRYAAACDKNANIYRSIPDPFNSANWYSKYADSVRSRDWLEYERRTWGKGA